MFEGREQAPAPVLLGAGGGRPLPCCSWGAEPNICSRLRAVPSPRSCEEARARPARAQRVSAPEHRSREDAAGSPQPCWRGPQALQCLAASSTPTATWDGAWCVLWGSSVPCTPNSKSCCLSPISCPQAESGQYPAHKGADAATAAVGCNAASLSASNKRDAKGHLEITAVPGSHKHSPSALEAPRDMQSPGDWLQSYNSTPQHCSTHRPSSLLLQPLQQKVLTQQPAPLAPSVPLELLTAAKPCSIPLTPTATQMALGNTQGRC